MRYDDNKLNVHLLLGDVGGEGEEKPEEGGAGQEGPPPRHAWGQHRTLEVRLILHYSSPPVPQID